MLPSLLLLTVALAQQPMQDSAYTRTEAMIPMRDGVKLHTVIEAPRNATGPLGILMDRTPYGADGAAAGAAHNAGYLGLSGLIIVAQDIRGRFQSEGTFAMNRPPHSGPQGTDESTDTYDTIDWLVKNVPNNNGRVGVFGISYPGWLTAVAGIGAHPALRALSPQAPMGDAWMGDDFFHQGAFRVSYGLEYSWMMEASPDLSGSLPRYFTHTVVPTLTVGGWWDQEDEYGPLASYAALEKTDTAGVNFLVMGPWYHGQWFADSATALGNIRFGRATGVDFRALQTRWFAYWLKGEGDGKFPEATVFDAGSNEWRTFDKWPPAAAQTKHLYFRENGRLSFDPPAAATGADQYVSDPAHPVPYRPRPVERTYSPPSRWRRWETEDQRFVDGRPDVLTWQTAPLTEDVTVAGNIVAHLYAATTGSDADWVVKLIDVYPDTIPDRPAMGGYELMVTGDIMRGRYRGSWEHPQAIPPNQVVPFTVDLHQQAYTFKKGHRIMVQVQSTWFPLYDRNPQTFVPNIFKATAADYRAATHRVYRTARYPSSVAVDVLRP